MPRRPTQPIPEGVRREFYLSVWDMAYAGSFVRRGQRWPERERVGRRTGLLILTMTSAALRFSEAARLELRDLTTADGSLRVQRSKGGRSAAVKIGEDLARLLSDWRAGWGGRRPSKWLFPSERGTPIDCDTFNDDYLRPLGDLFGFALSSHCFRDTACQLAMVQTQDVRGVQRFMGHTSARTTEIYLRKQAAAEFQLVLPGID